LGHLDDVARVHQAADIYLYSCPFSSLTSLLEAGAVGAPVITYRGHPAGCAVFGADSPGVDELMFRPGDPEGLSDVITRLARDAGLRRERGAATSRAVLDSHVGALWRRGMEELYALGRPTPHRSAAPVHRLDDVDLMTAAVQQSTAHCRDADLTVGAHLGAFPLRDRVTQWLRLRNRVGARALAPDWVVSSARLRR